MADQQNRHTAEHGKSGQNLHGQRKAGLLRNQVENRAHRQPKGRGNVAQPVLESHAPDYVRYLCGPADAENP